MTRKPLIDNRLRNVLLSMGACIALMMAYYMAIGQDKIPPDTQIVYQGCDGQPCRAFRLSVDAGGAVMLKSDSGIRHYHVPVFAVQRVMRVFKRRDFLDRDIMAYNTGVGPACLLSLETGHRKTALALPCSTLVPEIAKPILALEDATRFREVLAGNPAIMRNLKIETAN
ncbi:MAG: hypothetical protein WDN06_15780 [Asticcacaulis sp.]